MCVVFFFFFFTQIENEYGHNDLGNCDKEYTLWLRDLMLSYVGEHAQLYTTDECDSSYLKCGQIPNVYSTVDFAAIVNGKIKSNYSNFHSKVNTP